MSLTKEVLVDQVTVEASGTMLVRETTRIMDDGVEISKTYHRSSFAPGSDLADQPANVVAIANAVWTPELLTKYQADQAAAIAARASQKTPA